MDEWKPLEKDSNPTSANSPGLKLADSIVGASVFDPIGMPLFFLDRIPMRYLAALFKASRKRIGMGVTAAWDPMADDFHRLLTELVCRSFAQGEYVEQPLIARKRVA